MVSSSILIQNYDEAVDNFGTLIICARQIDGVQNKLNILKEAFSILIIYKNILYNFSELRKTLSNKILEFHQDEIAKADQEFINLSNIIIKIISDYENYINQNKGNYEEENDEDNYEDYHYFD